jgi:hypothetical protein
VISAGPQQNSRDNPMAELEYYVGFFLPLSTAKSAPVSVTHTIRQNVVSTKKNASHIFANP